MTEVEVGVYQMKELLYGKYFVKETKAPEGFILDDNVYPVSIEENGKTVVYDKSKSDFSDKSFADISFSPSTAL